MNSQRNVTNVTQEIAAVHARVTSVVFRLRYRPYFDRFSPNLKRVDLHHHIGKITKFLSDETMRRWLCTFSIVCSQYSTFYAFLVALYRFRIQQIENASFSSGCLSVYHDDLSPTEIVADVSSLPMIIRINHSWLLSHQCHLIVFCGIAYDSTLCISNYRAHQLRESRIVIWFSKKHLLHNTKQYPGADDDDTSLKRWHF